MYYLVYGPLYLLSLLPLRVLYLLSDFAYVLVYHLVGYRKKVVRYNLSVAFPNKTEKERQGIEKKFYKNFTDSFIETIKALSASPQFIKEHFTGDFSVFDELNRKGVQKVQLHSGHNFNWEYGNLSIPLQSPYPMLTVYMPITNSIFNRLFYKMRSKTGAKLLSATNIRSEILPHRHGKYVLALVADQNPGHPKSAYWVNFFERPTPFVKAPESGARRGNIPVVFCYFRKEKRGYYRIHFQLAEEHPSTTEVGELTKKYAAFLQDAIKQQPDNWLWSHRRWKWDWKEEYGKIIE
ncbi:lysophospholipid acyltransferase family protein [Flavisolibacter ginsenosidimutans]|uniref:Lipid A biosynthesis acyltransferase n=1 Tax=Flavisolibacter ginsenosidimutans TaxID=661481 RepID=A0A5B8UJZ8_9BACT|nr:lysophospholipid acyltransferase family protein [Flavisolibacter ginsenosidimutans]QEC56883.1 lipid A biosynthesis acyltransferase [Flavisolibacter ginsenosidimutans]